MSVPKRTDGTWRKSSHSGNENCVEVKLAPDGVGVRDTKALHAGELDIPAASWTALLEQMK